MLKPLRVLIEKNVSRFLSILSHAVIGILIPASYCSSTFMVKHLLLCHCRCTVFLLLAAILSHIV